MPPVHDLPERLVLPLESGESWWYWLGGRPALDLVNTLRERWRRRVETLVTPEDLGRWLGRAGLVAGPSQVSERTLADARELREAIDACVRAALSGRPPPAGAVATIDAWLAHGVAQPALVLDASGTPVLAERTPSAAAEHALGTIALDAARMLGLAEERGRLRICASDTCSARFYDRSPAGRRLWCSMRTCGNEAKARRHRERAKNAVETSGTARRLAELRPMEAS
jgi:predicted RNA-binding Zn ribbon-like protein